MGFNASRLGKNEKVDSLHVTSIKMYRDEAVGLSISNLTLKITIFLNKWTLGQFHENLIFRQ